MVVKCNNHREKAKTDCWRNFFIRKKKKKKKCDPNPVLHQSKGRTKNWKSIFYSLNIDIY